MTINFCTGKANDPYNVAGQEIAKFKTANDDINVIPDTGGTWANIERTVLTPLDDPDACHAMIGQPDGKSHLERTEPAAADNLRKVALTILSWTYYAYKLVKEDEHHDH